MSSGSLLSGGAILGNTNVVLARSPSATSAATAMRMPPARKRVATIRRWRTIRLRGVLTALADQADDGHDSAKPANDARDRADRLHQGGRIVGPPCHPGHDNEKPESQQDHHKAGHDQPPIRLTH